MQNMQKIPQFSAVCTLVECHICCIPVLFHVHPLLPDNFRCGTNVTRHPPAPHPGQLSSSSLHRVHRLLPDKKERYVGQENGFGTSQTVGESRGGCWLGSNLSGGVCQGQRSQKKQLLPTCSIRDEENPSLTLLWGSGFGLPFLNLLCRSLGEDFAI